MNPLEALLVVLMEDVSSLETMCTYFLLGVVALVLLEGPILRAGYPMGWSDRFWVILGWPLALALCLARLFTSK
tara:strand:- start:203 stop:424 length:222 start_codon:yes stop_codon:yes gene_type:complete